MKILFTSHLFYDDPGYKGGGWINALVDRLKRIENIEVAIIYPSYTCNKRYNLDNVTYYPVPIKLTLFSKLNNIYGFKPQLVQNDEYVQSVLDDFHPDIIQVFGLETLVTNLVRNVKTVPVIVHIQGISEEVARAWYPSGFNPFGIWRRYPLRDILLRKTTVDKCCRLKALSKIETENYKRFHYYLGRTEWDKEVSKRLSPKRNYYHCDEVIRDEFYKYNWSYTSGKIRLVSVNNGELYKGFDIILKCAKLLKTSYTKDFEWLIVGLDENAQIIKIVEDIIGTEFSDNNVFFKGKMNADELAKTLSSSTLFIHPSHVDNSPNSLCEAMIVGIPCIASNIGGIPTLIHDNINGRLYNDKDAKSLFNTIIEIVENKEELQRMSSEAYKDGRIRHDDKCIIDKLLKTYQEVINDFKMKCNV